MVRKNIFPIDVIKEIGNVFFFQDKRESSIWVNFGSHFSFELEEFFCSKFSRFLQKALIWFTKIKIHSRVLFVLSDQCRSKVAGGST